MNIFITGGTGLIGQALIQEILQSQNESKIWVLTRDKARARQQLPDKVELIEQLHDIRFSDLDVVVNLAGAPIVDKRWSDKQKLNLCHSRWHLTQAIVEKIDSECQPEQKLRFISGSAVGIYGRQDSKIITEEFTGYFSEFSHHLCQKWEDIASSSSRFDVALLRTGIVLSDKGGALKKMLLPFKLGLGGRIASGEQFMPWIHIDDMIQGILFLIDHPVITGPVNFTAPNPVSNSVFSQTLAQTLKRAAIFPVPEFVLRMLLGEMADLVVFGQNVHPHKLLGSGFKFKFSQLPSAMADLLLKK